MFRVKFNLQRGNYYGYWQIKDMDTKEVVYLHPDDFRLCLIDCRLINKRKISDKIYNGKTTKTVCAWVECRDYTLVGEPTQEVGSEVCFNPHEYPFWTLEKCRYSNIDDRVFETLITEGKKIFIYKFNT